MARLTAVRTKPMFLHLPCNVQTISEVSQYVVRAVNANLPTCRIGSFVIHLDINRCIPGIGRVVKLGPGAHKGRVQFVPDKPQLCAKRPLRDVPFPSERKQALPPTVYGPLCNTATLSVVQFDCTRIERVHLSFRPEVTNEPRAPEVREPHVDEEVVGERNTLLISVRPDAWLLCPWRRRRERGSLTCVARHESLSTRIDQDGRAISGIRIR